MRAVSVYEAKTHLSRLLRRVRNGEQFVLSVSGRPVARLIPIGPAEGVRQLGGDEGLVWEADDFNAPLSPDVLAAFWGGSAPAARRGRGRPCSTKRRRR